MNVIQDDIRDAIEKELTSAKERFPLFSSFHEAIAVIAEEYEEAAADLTNVRDIIAMERYKEKQHYRRVDLTSISRLKHEAEELAIEACQIAAMCEKAVQSAAEWNDERKDNEKC